MSSTSIRDKSTVCAKMESMHFGKTSTALYTGMMMLRSFSLPTANWRTYMFHFMTVLPMLLRTSISNAWTIWAMEPTSTTLPASADK